MKVLGGSNEPGQNCFAWQFATQVSMILKPHKLLVNLQRVESRVQTPLHFPGVVGLDFKTEAIITRASSTLPLNTALILINNKGYPIYHDRLEEYAIRKDVTTKLQDFQYSDDNQKVSCVLR
jgi:hypothetical protein